MTDPTPDQITAATAGLKDPKARERAVQWLRRWQKAAPELFVEPPRKADPPWEYIDKKWVCFAVNKAGKGYFRSAVARVYGDAWVMPRLSDETYATDFIVFDEGNMPWDESIVYRPGHGPEGGA